MKVVLFARRAAAPSVAVASAFGLSAAHAAAVDVSAVTADITSQIGSVSAIGGAVLMVIVAIAAFVWLKRVL